MYLKLDSSSFERQYLLEVNLTHYEWQGRARDLWYLRRNMGLVPFFHSLLPPTLPPALTQHEFWWFLHPNFFLVPYFLMVPQQAAPSSYILHATAISGKNVSLSSLSRKKVVCALNQNFQNQQKKNWITQKKLFDPTFFSHNYTSNVKFHQDFESVKTFVAPPQKNQNKSIFWGNCAHTTFAPLHIRPLFIAHTTFVWQIIFSVAHTTFARQFFQFSVIEMHIRHLMKHIQHFLIFVTKYWMEAHTTFLAGLLAGLPAPAFVLEI